MAAEDDQPNDQAEQFAAFITGLIAACRALYTAAKPTMRKFNAEANRLRVAAEPRLAELFDHVERVRAAAEPTVRRVSDDMTLFRAAAEPKVLVAVERVKQTRAATQPALDRADEIAGRVRKWTQENRPGDRGGDRRRAVLRRPRACRELAGPRARRLGEGDRADARRRRR
jgi:hypothetical protein